MSADAQDKLIRRLVDKIRKNTQKIIRLEEVETSDAPVVVVAYGCTSRTAREAVQLLRSQGKKVGLLRLITLWPFPEERISRLSKA